MCAHEWEATQEASCSTTGCAASTTFALPAATTTFQSLTLTASMRGDFGLSSETAEVLVDGVVVGTCFETGGTDCTADVVECLVQDVLSESLVDGDSTVSIGFEASSVVNHCTPYVHAEFTLRVGCHSPPASPPPPSSPPPSQPECAGPDSGAWYLGNYGQSCVDVCDAQVASVGSRLVTTNADLFARRFELDTVSEVESMYDLL